MPHRDLIVCGAGAAGLLAALRAAQCGASVTLLEKNRRPGVKILASGGGRCNLTTTRQGGALLRSFREPQAAFLKPAFKALSPRRLRELFASWGVETREEELEKVFPVAGRASVVLEALLRAIDAAGVELRTRCEVRGLHPAEGGWRVELAEGEDLHAARVVLATGGRSYPKTGTVGDGYRMAKHLGLEVTPLFPALVGLTLTDGSLSELAGTAVPGAEAQVWRERKLVARWERPVLFTHHGLSGPGAMDAAGELLEHRASALRLDLLPRRSFEEIDRELGARLAQRGGPTLLHALPPELPRRLRERLIAEALEAEGAQRGVVSRDVRRAVVHRLKGWELAVSGSRGWHHAEVTRGGIALGEVDPKTYESRRHPGLHVIGEVLDLDGPIGGFNFQAAFAAGWVAGEAAARAVAAR